jgi:uncharacterized lipoprotein YehR (DUF1307 family)
MANLNDERPEGLVSAIPEGFDYDFVSEIPAPEMPKEEERVVNLFPEMSEKKQQAIEMMNAKVAVDKIRITRQMAQYKEIEEFDNLQKEALNQSESVDLDKVDVNYYKYLSCGDFANIKFYNTLYFIGGYTNSGKSILARSILVHVCKTDNIKVLYFTPETNTEQTASKLKEYISVHPNDNLKANIKNNVTFNDKIQTVNGVLQKIETWLKENDGERVILIDYMQMFQGNGKMCDVYPVFTQKLLNVVKNTGVSIILFAQLKNKQKGEADFKSRVSNSYNSVNAVQELVEIYRNEDSPVESFLQYHKTKQDLPSLKGSIWYYPDSKMLLTTKPSEEVINAHAVLIGWKPANEQTNEQDEITSLFFKGGENGKHN